MADKVKTTPIVHINKELDLRIDSVILKGNLVVPEGAKGLVIFSHGAGSSRHSPRNNYVARMMNEQQLGTLLLDLLTEKEDKEYSNRFDIELLTERLFEVTEQLEQDPVLKELPFGYFGASTGAASALSAAARLPDRIVAVVSRGGRPDLAMYLLPKVKSPVLLIVGALDQAVVDLNEKAFGALMSVKEMVVVGGATHLFEEPGKLEEVARLSIEWFDKYFEEA